ncbi:MAG: elongation factor G [Actinobacteria bacterium]|nr:elongation factor G [Actinomycetota bacterium]MCL6105522.1 elongation factor G [Actinomycetota bacterium]
MKNYPSGNIRNLAVIGHGGTGKTTLVEALLFVSKATTKMGNIQDGTTVCDFEPEAIKRHMSVSMSLAPIEVAQPEVDNCKINLLDTPGYADFIGEVATALSVVESALVVVSAVDAVEVQTEAVWKLAEKLKLPRMIFVNKLDRENADFSQALKQLRAAFGPNVVPLQIPIGNFENLAGIVDLLQNKAFFNSLRGTDGKGNTGGKGGTNKITGEPIPEELATSADFEELKDMFVEGVVVADDTLMENYLAGNPLPAEQLRHALSKGIVAGSIFPVVCGSATKLVGIDRLASLICETMPCQLEAKPTLVQAGDTLHEISPDATANPLLKVFKTIVDPYMGKVSLLKVVTGTLKPDSTFINPRTHHEERIHALATMRGKEHINISEATAGEIVALPKLGNTLTGDTLAPKNTPAIIPVVQHEPPVIGIAIHPKAKGDDDKLMTALHRLCEEDTYLVVNRNDETKQTVIYGSGETHLAIACERLKTKFSVEIVTEEIQIAYRETITIKGQGEGKYKKQSGGHGQFGVANLKVEPLKRGEGFVFVDQVVGGAIPKQFIPAVEKGIREAMEQGPIFGYPVVDVKAICYDGKYHPVDSSEMSFKMAGLLGFKEAVGAAAPVLLEPISRIEVTIPSVYQGEVLGDLNSRRARIVGTESGEDGQQVVIALVPEAEVLRYAVDLRALTRGRGKFTLRHDHYDVVPQQIAQKLPKRGELAEAGTHL